ncbi:hypothetical protein ADK35_08015 [Streptomyces viridochromogenes]|uniref:hypothetical protein n=1 Tax=Streptomyces viridochromogenes TaxID=1938 RepID=UPI00069FD872|nr:hypothetical protein [Streptomyces viridochromogenes]KOG25960.1 hypothetical protein ADK35_08015 [Streptomyces viridochromogenes]
MIALAYLATVAVSLVVLAVALRRRPGQGATPPPEAPAPIAAELPPTAEAEIRLILAAATQLAARLTPAA